MNVKSRLSKAIIRVIKDNGLSNAKLAKALGVHTGTVDGYRRMTTSPSAVFVERLCNKYNVNPAYIVTGEGGMFLDEGATGSCEKEFTPPGDKAAVNDLRRVEAILYSEDAYAIDVLKRTIQYLYRTTSAETREAKTETCIAKVKNRVAKIEKEIDGFKRQKGTIRKEDDPSDKASILKKRVM